MAIEDIVNVNVTIASATVSQKGFGTPLLFGYHTKYQDLVRTYKASSWSTALVADGFTSTDALYVAAKQLMAQSPRPKEFKIGKRATAETQSVRLTPTVGATAQTHSLVIEGPDGTKYTASFTSDGTPTVAEVCTGLAAAINALAVAVTATDSVTHVDVVADATNTYYSYHSLSSTLSLTDTTPTAGSVADDLNAIWAADSDWYGLCLVSSSPTAIEACADWAEAMPVVFTPNTHDMSILTNATTDVASSVQDQAYARTMVMYHSRALEFAGTAWMGKMLPYEPGAATWKFKTLKGVSADKLSATQETYAAQKNAAFYTTILGVNIAGEGAAGDGTFLDLTQLSDWFAARVKERVFGALAANPKVPFTDEGGGSIIYGAIKSVIEEGQRNKAIDTDPDTWAVEVPAAATVPALDRAARKWTGINTFFKATGAVHSVDTINVFLNI